MEQNVGLCREPDLAMVREAFLELYSEKDFNFKVIVKYSKRMKDYNAGLSFYKSDKKIVFRFGEKWHSVSAEIKKGLVQELLLKLFEKKKSKKQTVNMELYHKFIKNVHLAVPKTKIDTLLEESFERVNEEYFNGLLEKPNLVFGSSSFRKLAGYDYQNDTITVSTLFKDSSSRILDYLIYHELLHKKLKFVYKNGKNYQHTSDFKHMERKFKNAEEIEKEIDIVLRNKKRSLRKSAKNDSKGFFSSIFNFR